MLAAGCTEERRPQSPLAFSEQAHSGVGHREVGETALDRCLAPALQARAIISSALLGFHTSCSLSLAQQSTAFSVHLTEAFPAGNKHG